MEAIQQEVMEHTLKIGAILHEAPNVKTFRMHLPAHFPMNFFPGQFYMVRFPDDKMHRAYSIASSPTDIGFLDITLDKVGVFTTRLFEAKVGDELVFKGPYGKFYFSDAMKNDLVLIGGGLGITPLRSILRYCKDKHLKNKINLIYSVKAPHEIVYLKELESYKNQMHQYHFLPTVTRLQDGMQWPGRIGRVDEIMLKENVFKINQDLFFMCGPLSFVKSVREMLYAMGVMKEQIKTDIWGE